MPTPDARSLPEQTPLTDAAAEWIADRGMTEWVPVELARDLEKRLAAATAERDALKASFTPNGALARENDTLRVQLAAATTDKERLDWLEQKMTVSFRRGHPADGLTWLRLREGGRIAKGADMRSAIDAARQSAADARPTTEGQR